MYPWPSIDAFYNIRKLVKTYPELLLGNPVVQYKSKIKQHGTNAAIVLADNTIRCQSRTAIITPQKDNVGFAAWVEKQKDQWLALGHNNLVIFGEWAGQGIQKGAAVCQVPEKFFAAFGAIHTDSNVFISDPDKLHSLVGSIPGVYILPWHHQIEINWFHSAEQLQSQINILNEEVKKVEDCDPWIKETFGIEGIGEGLVYYPISHPGFKSFSSLSFKVKGEQHKVVKTKESVQIDPEMVKSVEEFISLVLTENRLEQGVRAVADGELKFEIPLLGKFIGWISQDVKKETSSELEASGLKWKDVNKPLGTKTRDWYLSKVKES